MKVVNKKRHAPGPADVYIGRGPRQCHMMNTVPGQRGWLGNPVFIGRECPVCGERHNDGGSTLECYRELLWDRINLRPDFCAQLVAVSMMDDHAHQEVALVCWCKPAPCHGDVLKEVLETEIEQIIHQAQ